MSAVVPGGASVGTAPGRGWNADPARSRTPGGRTGADMPIPKVVGQWNKAGLNHLTRHIAPWMPGFGVIVHRGRRSGRRYQTPVDVFSAGNGYVIALTYGPQTDWVKNVLAAGGCELRHPRPDHPAGLTTPIPRPKPLQHPSPRAAGTADPQRRRILVPHTNAGQPDGTRPAPSMTVPGRSRGGRTGNGR
jgi:hypothetical protein